LPAATRAEADGRGGQLLLSSTCWLLLGGVAAAAAAGFMSPSRLQVRIKEQFEVLSTAVLLHDWQQQERSPVLFPLRARRAAGPLQLLQLVQ
jgi:hypothetical protein